MEPIPISALQHWSYCPRQCALIHQEQIFSENVHTLRGRATHGEVDRPGYSAGANVRIVRALPLYCDRLGLVGTADLVEFDRNGTPCPVEYKHGPKRQHHHDDLQVAAQAMCLEEMTGHPISRGAVFHASSRRRRLVEITVALRLDVEQAVEQIRSMLASGTSPPPVNDGRCPECSLRDVCQPAVIANTGRRRRVHAELFADG